MAAPAGASNSTFSRRVAPFVPVALSLLLSRSILPVAAPEGEAEAPNANGGAPVVATCEADIGSVEVCHSYYPTGCSKSAHPAYDPYLNLLKNQLLPPSSPALLQLDRQAFIDLNSKTPAGLRTGNHAQFSQQLGALQEGQVASLIGYLYYAQYGGKSESVNCQLGDPDEIDFHIGIGFDPTLAGKLSQHQRLTPDENATLEPTSVIVEMTPHYRAHFEPDWTLDALKNVLGRQVRVTGQLLIDNEHVAGNANCGAPHADTSKCWRFSAWELHPVTKFEICQSDSQPCAAGDWVALEAMPQAASNNSPANSAPAAGAKTR
ncbi:MAG: hypothetical protein JO340_14920 [Acidobacteriaceae bacterium]|nr:hypothetical protein [Acidobacteriaceae bacterium]